ncbi:conserved hypothetical protein [Trichinella spiralis]|uniref:hypothetical protein n=1 Tax=Trichinella spiralis TaxID=6334 RepID=UPI0001EFB761|nr:conserved hypothetical protein [Trichinella spiralis]
MCGESVLSRSFQVNGDVAFCLPSGVGMITLSPCIKRSGLWRQVRKCSGGAERLRNDYAFFVVYSRFLVWRPAYPKRSAPLFPTTPLLLETPTFQSQSSPPAVLIIITDCDPHPVVIFDYDI